MVPTMCLTLRALARWSFPWDKIRVSRCQHCWHLGPDNSLLWGVVLCIIGCLAESRASTHEMPVVPLQLWQPKMVPDIAKCPLRDEVNLVENHWTRLARALYQASLSGREYISQRMIHRTSIPRISKFCFPQTQKSIQCTMLFIWRSRTGKTKLWW